MRDFKADVIGKIKKVFKIRELSAKHIYYEILYEGKVVAKTHCSFGATGKDIPDSILGEIKRQLKLNNTRQVYDLKNCSMRAEDYFNLLKQKNVISN